MDCLAKPDLSNLSYDPEKGHMTWIKSRGSRKSGSLAGWNHNDGYIGISINGKHYLQHRIAYWMMGEDPNGYQVDHKNGIRNDNRWLNLRLTDNSGNQCNVKSHRRGKIPYLSYRKCNQKWMVRKSRAPKFYAKFETENEAIDFLKENNIYKGI